MAGNRIGSNDWAGFAEATIWAFQAAFPIPAPTPQARRRLDPNPNDRAADRSYHRTEQRGDEDDPDSLDDPFACESLDNHGVLIPPDCLGGRDGRIMRACARGVEGARKIETQIETRLRLAVRPALRRIGAMKANL